MRCFVCLWNILKRIWFLVCLFSSRSNCSSIDTNQSRLESAVLFCCGAHRAGFQLLHPISSMLKCIDGFFLRSTYICVQNFSLGENGVEQLFWLIISNVWLKYVIGLITKHNKHHTTCVVRYRFCLAYFGNHSNKLFLGNAIGLTDCECSIRPICTVNQIRTGPAA